MNKFSIPLWTLMVAIVLVALGFQALKHPSELVNNVVFTLTVVLFAVAVLVAVATTKRRRLAWLSFALFGGITLVMEFVNPMSIEGYRQRTILITDWLDYGLSALQFHMLGITCDGNQMDRYYQIGQALGATLVGFLASFMTLFITAFIHDEGKT